MKLPENYVLGVGVVKPTAKGGFGQKMLEKLGWREGEGLGKNKTGMLQAIDVKKKNDKDGVSPWFPIKHLLPNMPISASSYPPGEG